MKKPKVLFGKIFVLVLLFVLSGCGETNVINVGCSAPELIDAINQANSDANTNTLNLTTDCEYILDLHDNTVGPLGSSFGANGLPVITSLMTINGNNAHIRRNIIARNFRIFFIDVGGNLTLNNVSLENGRLQSYPGGAIYNYRGTLHLNDSTVRDSHAKHGGGIYNDHLTTVVISHSTFINNTAQYGGGAISGNCPFGESILFIWEDSLFQENSSEGVGGAIVNGGPDCAIEVADSTFSLNEASIEGGAIYNSGITTVRSGTLFDQNTAGNDGGAIYIFTSSTFTSQGNNTYQGNVAGNNGGAVYNGFGNFTSQDGNTYRDNTAVYFGGAIYNDSHNLSINNNIFEGNDAGYSGGAIYNRDNSTGDIVGGRFSGNTAEHGGAIWNGGHLDIVEVTLGNQNNWNEATDEGGAISNWGEMDILRSTIEFNRARTGGGVYNCYPCILNIRQTTLNDNEAFGEGGAILSIGDLKLNNSTIAKNIADEVGGVSITNGAAVIEFCTIMNNTNTRQQKGSNFFGGGTVQIKHSILAKNDGDCMVTGAAVTVRGKNLDSDGSCPNFAYSGEEVDNQALADNGGWNKTIALYGKSPAIDAVPLAECTFIEGQMAQHDQRGVQRPQGTDCDIGAVEVEAPDLQPMPPSTPPPTQPPYACVELLGVTVRGDGTIRIQLETQDLPEGEYEAEVGKYDFTCKTYRDYPDRLFCDGPKGKGGTLVTLTIFDADGETICQEDFTIPAPEQPATKESSEGVDCTEKYGDNYSSCVLDPACKWSDPDYMCYNK